MPDIFDQAASSASTGDIFDQAASHASYWQELYQQSGIPGLVKGLKEHPAETIAGAIGGLFAPLNPNFTQSEQGKALKENLTRSPESLAAALTLGGVAAVPAVGRLAPGAVSAVSDAAANAAKFTSAAAKTAAPGLISAGTKLAAGHMLSEVPGLEWPARLALEYPAIHQGIKTLGKAYQAGKAAIQPAEESATEAAAPRPPRASLAPSAATPPPAPTSETPSTAPGKTAADLLNEEMGTKEAAPPVTAKAPGQALAESHGETWSKLSQDDKLSYAQMEGAQASSEARNPAPPPYVPRGPEHYGVKPAEVPPTNPAPSAPAPAQPAPAAAPPVTSIQPNGGPLRPPVATPAPAAPASTIPFEAVRKTGPQDALEGVGGGVGPGFTVYKVPTEKLVPTEDISGMPEKMADVAKYADKLKAGSEPPALFGHYDPDTGNVVVTSGSRRMMAAQQAGAPDVPVAIPKAAPGAEETLGVKPEPPQPKTASGATAAKSARYADAIAKWAKDMGMSPKAIADQWGSTTPEVRGQIILQLKQKGYLEARETIPNTSAQGIIDALKAKAVTIKPPKGFSLGEMATKQ